MDSDYQLLICTPEWLCKHRWLPELMRHTLLVRKYDMDEIKKTITDYNDQSEGNDWMEISQKIFPASLPGNMKITSLEQDPGPAGLVIFTSQLLSYAFIPVALEPDRRGCPKKLQPPGQEMFCHYRHADGMTKPSGQGHAPTPPS
ncbi:Imm8 family immunity protein [Dickeya lacustris]|uniref:Imm8 family immunity protein n=1 Tax=Dickeya lacustris TaxID=2259638 RepID=A0ABY8G8J1_9GAMM|nr:Imm8 family immunity protein [Dickeya lacustris]WFN56219.1 Imm8 family immunity protein [Dickeya lacustris]